MNLSTKIVKNDLVHLKSVKKKLHYLNLITKYKNNIEKLGKLSKFDRKSKINKKMFPQKIITENKVVTDTEVTGKHFAITSC